MPVEATMAVAATAAIASMGIQMYSSQQAAASQAQIAEYNRQVNQQNANWQMMAQQRAAQSAAYNAQLQAFNAQAQQAQAQFTAQMSRYSNEQLRMQADFTDMQAQLQRNTAAMLRQEGDAGEKTAQDQADRIRKEKERILGLQRSQYARANVLPQGSPLAILSEANEIYEMQAVDTRLLANLEANKRRYEAGVTDFNAGITSLEAGAQRDQAKLNDSAIEFNLSQDLFKANLDLSAARQRYDDAMFERESAGAGNRIAQRQAEIEYMSGMARSRASSMETWSALAGGVGNLASIGSTYYGTRASKANTYNVGTLNLYAAK